MAGGTSTTGVEVDPHSIARCRLNYPLFTSDHPGLSCSNALSRCRPVLHRNVFRLAMHVHGGALVLSRSDTIRPG